MDIRKTNNKEKKLKNHLIKAHCTHCNQENIIDENKIMGKYALCKHCGERFKWIVKE